MQQKLFISIFISLFSVGYTANAWSAQWYQVEVMLIAYTDINDIEKEYWPIELETPPVFNKKHNISWLSPLNSQATNQRVIRRFGAPNAKNKTTGQLFAMLKRPSLSGYVKQINKQKNMQVIWQQSWLEPIQSKAKASAHQINLNLKGNPNIKLQGEISLYRSRYLHISTNLHLRHYAQGTEKNSSQQAQNYNIVDVPMRAALIRLSRRMRSNEIHYLDHPMLGVVIKTRPVSEL